MKRTTHTAAVLAGIFVAFVSFTAAAETPQATDLTSNFQSVAAGIDRLQVYEIAGVVLIRGRAVDKASAEQLGALVKERGYARVANLIQIVVAEDDAAIERTAERELTVHRALDGCKFRIDSDNGVINLAGSVRHELQKDVAEQILRSIDGVRGVKIDLQRF